MRLAKNILFLTSVLLASLASGSVNLVQSATGNATTAATSKAVTLPSVAAGNTIVVVWGSDTAGNFTSCSDPSNGTYSLIGPTSFKQGTNVRAGIVYRTNAAAGTRTITCTFSAASKIAMVVAELSGVDTTNPVDLGSVSNSGSGTAITCGTTFTSNTSNEYSVASAVNASFGTMSTSATGYTLVNSAAASGAPNAGFIGGQFYSFQAFSPTATTTNSANWACFQASFRAAIPTPTSTTNAFPNSANVIDVSGVGTVSWTNPASAAISDNVRASAATGASKVSHYLEATNFGIAVPTGAHVTGVKATLERNGSTSTCIDSTVKLIVNGALVGNNRANLDGSTSARSWASSTDRNDVVGGTNDTWGTALAATDVSSTGFGVALSGTNTAACTLNVDSMSLTVSYYPLPVITSISPAAGAPIGQTITISGANFYSSFVPVYFRSSGNSPAAPPVGPTTVEADGTVLSPTLLTVQVPSGAISGPVYLSVFGANSNTYSYSINGQAATPTFSPVAGTYSSAQSVTITSATSGTTIHYTTDGSTPNASSPTAQPVNVSTSETIKAIATSPSYLDSSIATANYVINGPAATPIFSPVAGTYASPQSVTISSTTTGATIYYTLDGSTPTTASLTAQPISAGVATTTIKALAVATNYQNSSVAIATYVVNGPAATPTFSPVASTYASAQSVTISSMTPGATIYYTTDGSTPTGGSLTAQPVSVSATETIKAIALAANYLSSAVASANYVIAVPPSITASQAPQANSNGWNDTNVTVSFTCTPGTYPIATCSAPVTVTAEGTQSVSGQAVDTGGLTATTSATVKLDKTVPTLSIASPHDGDTVTTSTITVSGSAQDALSGLSSVTCNGAVGTINGNTYSCGVTLAPGGNTIQVVATDFAGNPATAVVNVNYAAPVITSIRVVPDEVNLSVGQSRIMRVVDSNGAQVFGATWSISGPTGIVSLSSDASPMLTALSAGQVSVTASSGTLTAQAQVAVYSGSLPNGTASWVLHPLTTNGFMSGLVQAVPTTGGDGTVPDTFTFDMEYDTEGNPVLFVIGTTSDGYPLWRHPVNGSSTVQLSALHSLTLGTSSRGSARPVTIGGKPATPRQEWLALQRELGHPFVPSISAKEDLAKHVGTSVSSKQFAGQAFGKVAATSNFTGNPTNEVGGDATAADDGGELFLDRLSYGTQGSVVAIVKLAANGQEQWRYSTSNSLSQFAVHPDGTVFTVESSYSGPVNKLVAINGSSGIPKFTVQLPITYRASHNLTYNPNSSPSYYCTASPGSVNFDDYSPGGNTAPIVAGDGSVYLEVGHSTVLRDCAAGPNGLLTIDSHIDLLRVLADGTSSNTPIDSYSMNGCDLRNGNGLCFDNDTGSVGTPNTASNPGIIADNSGGVIFGWRYSQYFTPTSSDINFVTKIGHAQAGSITNTAIVAANTNPADNTQGPGAQIWYAGPVLLNGNGNVIAEAGYKIRALDGSSFAPIWTAGFGAASGGTDEQVSSYGAEQGNGVVGSYQNLTTHWDATGQRTTETWNIAGPLAGGIYPVFFDFLEISGDFWLGYRDTDLALAEIPQRAFQLDFSPWSMTDCGDKSKQCAAAVPVNVSFQQSDGTALPAILRVGISTSSHDRRQHLQVKIVPASEVSKIKLQASSGLSLTNQTTIGDLIKFDLVGTSKSATPGDANITATYKSGTTTQQVSVIVPSDIGQAHDTQGGGLVIRNAALDLNSTPAFGSPPGYVLLTTVYEKVLVIQVVDQFGNNLDSLYAGAAVYETDATLGRLPINVSLNSTGAYQDHVGAHAGGTFVPASNTSQINQWLASSNQNTFSSPNAFPENNPVDIEGFGLSPGIINRSVIVQPPSSIA